MLFRSLDTRLPRGISEETRTFSANDSLKVEGRSVVILQRPLDTLVKP